jgi:outer membrane protein assembly factor BamB
MNTRDSLSDSRPNAACAAFAPLLPLVSHHLLEAEEERRLAAHVADCARCQATLAAYARLDDALRQRFGQVAGFPLQSEDMMNEIRDQEQAGVFEPRPSTQPAEAPTLLPRPRGKTRRAISWMSTIAAALLITLIATALFVSRHPTTTGLNGSNSTATLPAATLASGVYFSGETAGPPAQTFLYALNPANGSVRWHIPMPTGPAITITPVRVDHGVLYVLAQDVSNDIPTKGATPTQGTSGSNFNAVYAFQASSGKALWHTALNAVPLSLIEANGALYVGTNTGGLYALNASTGAVQWHTTPGILVNMQVVGGLIYGGVYHSAGNNALTGALVALHASDGSLKWSFPLQGDEEIMQASGGRLAVVDTKIVAEPNGAEIRQWLYVLNASTGAAEWRYTGDPATLGSAFLEQDTVYVTLNNGPTKDALPVKLEALNASDGSVRWQKTYALSSVLSPDQGLAGGKVYLTTRDNMLYALNAQDGSVAWQAHLSPNVHLQRLEGATLYTETGTSLSAFNAADGAALWSYPTDDTGIIFGADSRAVYGIGKATNTQQHWLQQIFAVNASTGKLLWQYGSMSSIITPLIG